MLENARELDKQSGMLRSAVDGFLAKARRLKGARARQSEAIAQMTNCWHVAFVTTLTRRGQAMARFLAAIFLLAVLPGWTDTRGLVRVEAASPDKPYDFVVHVRNIPDIKYNPLVWQDRHRMARDLVRGECPRPKVVGEDTVTTEIYGITSSLPDYVVLVSCGRAKAWRRAG